MSDKLWRKTGDRDLDQDEVEELSPWLPVPGKVAVTARLAPRAQTTVVFRVESAEAAQAMAGSMGARDRNGVAAGADAAVNRAAGTAGSALPSELRSRFEASLGADLSSVRVHTGAESAAAAGAVGARAYTTGQDIHFAAGHYDPASAFGVHLLAHEVAHTVQQQGAPPSRQHKLEVSAPQDHAEVEADRAADAMVAGQLAEVSAGPTIAARAPDAAPAPKAAKIKKITVDAPVKPGNPIVFDAANYHELYKQILARSQSSKCAGQCDCGKVDCNYVTMGTTGTEEEKDNVVEATFTTQITTSIPSWTQMSSQPPDHQAKFKAWVASVAVHEAQHVKIYTDGLAKLKTAVVGPKESECDTQVGVVIAAIKTLQDAFDANKSTQPAPLAIPGGNSKIDKDGKETPAAASDEGAAPAADGPPGAAAPTE